jgi:hypothetical protein
LKEEGKVLPKKNSNRSSDLDKYILNIIRNEKPKTIKQLINSIQHMNNLPKQEIMQRILLLQDQGKIVLHDELPSSRKFKDYLFSIRAYWYLAIVALVITTTIIIIANLENTPIIGTIIKYTRYLFGSLFVLFLPGYSFIKALFPLKEIDNIERAALSIGMSLAIVAINALVLNYTPWGISTTPITLSLLCLTLTLSTIAIIREYQTLFNKQQKNNSTSVLLKNP